MAKSLWCILTRFLPRLLVMVLLFTGAQGLLVAPGAAQGIATGVTMETGPENTLGNRSDAEIWHDLRLGADGIVTPPSGPDAGTVINANGTWWSNMRRADGPLVRYGGYGLAGVVGILLLFFLIRGRIGYGEDSGKQILRFRLSQRVVHWTVAAIFILMASTGLILLFGRAYVVPFAGKTVYSVLATASMQAHNLFGPVFAVFLLAMLFLFIRGNIPKPHDIWWILKGGGFFGGHASAGKYNFGEKLWFWTAILAGITLTVTGFLMLFPDTFAPEVVKTLQAQGLSQIPPTRDTIHYSELAHAIAALIFIGYALGHIYLGTIGTKGSLKGMVDGKVDENWARAHHDLWLDLQQKKQQETEK